MPGKTPTCPSWLQQTDAGNRTLAAMVIDQNVRLCASRTASYTLQLLNLRLSVGSYLIMHLNRNLSTALLALEFYNVNYLFNIN